MWILYFIPKNLFSFIMGKLVHVRWPPPLGPWLLRWFINRYQINMSEAEEVSYASIGELFVRRLKPEARPLAASSYYIHPADALLVRAQTIECDQLIQAKDKTYSLKEFIRDTDGEVEKLYGGLALTYYLCPTDCHRVYSPVEGQIVSCRYIPGRLWPVNPWAVEHISQLFSLNERVVVWIQTIKGPIVVVMVGATNVGRISLSFEPRIVTNNKHFRQARHLTYTGEQAIGVKKAEELGVFHMGSTVIVLAVKGLVDMAKEGPFKVCWGQSLGVREDS